MFDIRRKKIIGISILCLSLLLTLPALGQRRAVSAISDFIQGVTGLLDNSTLISQNIPSTLRTGESYTVTIEMRNTGVHTWRTSNDYHLALYDASDHVYKSDVWGVRRVDLPYNVSPGDKVSFVFNIRAPSESGTYNNRWSMRRGTEFFGEATPYWAVSVSGTDILPPVTSAYNNAEFVNQTVPSGMYPGSTYHVLITMKNTGRATWQPSAYTYYSGNYKLASVSGNTIGGSRSEWSVSPLLLTQPVEPGNTVTFEFDVVAPSTPGTYNFQWQMMDGSMFFGQPTANLPITVAYSYVTYPPVTYPPPGAYYSSASFVSQSVPSVMTPGRMYSVSVTMNNSGSTTWYPREHHLMFTDPRMNPTVGLPWGISRVELPYTVYPGSNVTLDFYVTAPSTSGSYWWQWALMDGSHATLGSTTSLIIDVRY